MVASPSVAIRPPRPSGIPRGRLLIGLILIAVLPVLLIATLLWPRLGPVFLAGGLFFIVMTAIWGARAQRRVERVAPTALPARPGPLRGPLKDLERDAMRRGWLVASVPAAAFTAVVIFGTIVEPPAPNQYVDFALNIGPVYGLLLAFGLLLGVVLRQGVRRFAPLEARVTESRMAFRGPTLLLKEGILASFIWNGIFLTVFFREDGPLLHPKIDEALRWTGPGQLRRVGVIGYGKDTSPIRRELEAWRARLGGFAAVAVVDEPRTPAIAVGHRWAVSVNVLRMGSRPKIEQLAALLDAVEPFLRRVLEAVTERQV